MARTACLKSRQLCFSSLLMDARLSLPDLPDLPLTNTIVRTSSHRYSIQATFVPGVKFSQRKSWDSWCFHAISETVFMRRYADPWLPCNDASNRRNPHNWFFKQATAAHCSMVVMHVCVPRSSCRQPLQAAAVYAIHRDAHAVTISVGRSGPTLQNNSSFLGVICIITDPKKQDAAQHWLTTCKFTCGAQCTQGSGDTHRALVSHL